TRRALERQNAVSVFRRRRLANMNLFQKDHENAVAQATRTAFIEFLDRLDPAELEARFQRAARRGKTNPQYWGLYVEFYRNLIEMPADHLPHTFVEAFARAYRELLSKKPAD